MTDLPLTGIGRREARSLRPLLGGRSFAAVASSPRQRALETADLTGLTVTKVDADLIEWNYGKYEGVTTAQIHQENPQWSLWRDGCPGGEKPEHIGARLDRVLDWTRPLLAEGNVALVGHGHALRVLAARWVGLEPSAGAAFRLDTATTSTLGYERSTPVILRWNVPTPR